MPNGIHHHNIWKSGWIVIAPAVICAGAISPAISCGIVCGYLFGATVNGDSDQLAISYGDGIAIKRLWLFGWALVAYMTLYAAIFRKLHRSFWTHFPFVSTAIRWGYLFWWLWFVPYAWYDWQLLFLFSTYLGMSFSDIGHWASDTFWSRNE